MNQLALLPNTNAFATRGLPAKLTCSRHNEARAACTHLSLLLRSTNPRCEEEDLFLLLRGTRRFCEEEGLSLFLRGTCRRCEEEGLCAIPPPPKYSRLSLTKPRYLRSGELSLHPSETHNQPTAQHKWRLFKQTHAHAHNKGTRCIKTTRKAPH